MSGRLPRLRTAAVLAVAVLGATATPAAAEGTGGLITVLDNSQADSILEVDRTANLQAGSGTAGSDHDGSAVDLMEALVGVARAGAGEGG
ncbi:hypothetical protein [Streptomyces sp. NBC_00670]|uniref:hypothetical protein n=1 Tax=Streptomyces sp. NBC_00670 TaxID=2975804 RepID=UPI002E31FD8D|nr:hypothetical protein [Streptomyces sp. NBC_00670]